VARKNQTKPAGNAAVRLPVAKTKFAARFGRERVLSDRLYRGAPYSLFLSMCIDQVEFMEGLMQPDKLRTRILLCAEEEIRLDALPARSGNILEVVLYRGELPRSDAAAAVSATDRHAPRIVSALIEHGVLQANGARATTPGIPGRAGVALDARTVSRQDECCWGKELKFPAAEPRYVFDREVVVFWGVDGDKRVRCEISEEALDDHFDSDRKDAVKAFLAHEREVEEIARRKHLAGKTEPDGSVLIRTIEL